MAQAGGAETLTDALGAWTTHLWASPPTSTPKPLARLYIDSHRKPVFSDRLIPRGLIGRTGKVLGCRTLVLLHDAAGYPQLALTMRGDQHLTSGLPQLLTRYEQIPDSSALARVIVDREGMAAPFLQDLKACGYTVVTVLRSDQYDGLASFTEIGEFVPLERDRDGQVVREVAPACFALPMPDQAEAVVPLRVALIRDLRRQVSCTRQGEETCEDLRAPAWWQAEWKAQPTPATPTAPKLIPIVTTAATCDAVELAQTYTRRWPVQESVIRCWLLPLGLTNHGFVKTPVENSEIAKRREALERRLANIQRWAPKAHERAQRAFRLSERLRQETKAHGDALYRRINGYICEHDHGDEREWRLQHKPVVKAMKAEADADLDARWRRYERVRDREEREETKYTRYCLEQCDLLRALAELESKERAMYELENGKDQCMTVLKLSLANLGMWARKQYFPVTYAHAKWRQLLPFFRLPGRVTEGEQTIWVELRPFNDRQHNRDLRVVCERVAMVQPHLPDGRRLSFSLSQEQGVSVSNGQPHKVP